MASSLHDRRWRKGGRAALWLAAALGIIFLLLAAAVMFLLTTESGARLAWRGAVQAMPGKLSGEVGGGTLDGGIVLRNVVFADKGLRIAADRVETRWELLRGPAALHVFYVRAGRVDLSLAGGGQAPPAVPARLTLPMALQVDLVTLDWLVLHRNETSLQITDVRLHGRSNGVVHRMTLDTATTAYGKATASLSLNGLPPFTMSGGAVLTAANNGQPYRVDAELAGTLAAPTIRLQVDGVRLDADAQIGLAPFSGQPLRSVQASLQRFDPSRFRPQWPQADLAGQVSLAAPGAGVTLVGSARLENRQAGALDRGQIPFARARATLALGRHRSVIEIPEARLDGGALLTGSATLDQHGHGPLQLQVRGLDLQHIHTDLSATSLAGTVQAHLGDRVQRVALALAQNSVTMNAELVVARAAVQLRAAQLDAGRSRLALAGTFARGADQAFTARASLSNFDPAAVAAALGPRTWRKGALRVPPARINADLRVTGNMAPQTAARLTFELADSTYNALPLRGAGTLAVVPSGRIGGKARLEVAGNVFKVNGNVGRPGDTLRFTIAAPALSRLGYGVAGALEASGSIGGGLSDPVIDARLTGRALAFGQYRADHIAARARGLGLSPWQAQQNVSLVLEARGLRSAAATGSASARIAGSYGAHTIAVRVRGTLRGQPVQAALRLGGTLADPRLSGSVTGQHLGLTLFDYGLRLRDGGVRLTLANEVVQIEHAVFYGGQGTLRATGSFALDDVMAGAGPRIVADNLQVLSGPGGTLTLSGTAGVARAHGTVNITGAFVVDRARMRLPDLSVPALGGDVVVTRGGQVERAGRSPPWGGPAAQRGPRIVLNIGLGDDFRFSGGGADMLLAGKLSVRRAPAEPLQVNGTVRVVEGSYEAFGTELAVERGIINFQGAPDNPSVNIHAFRRGTEVEAGVVVTGTVQQPRVQLVAEPEVSEAETLSWLVFGHAGGGAGGQAGAAAQAAGVGLLNRFLGSRAAAGLRLDEFGIGSSSLSAQGGQVINIGKEITNRLYLAYEQSIAGSGSVLMLTYELSQFWSAVLYGGPCRAWSLPTAGASTASGPRRLLDRRNNVLELEAACTSQHGQWVWP